MDGADLVVNEAEIVGLIGPNGAGKSTFFNCLAGDAQPTSGSIRFFDQQVTNATPEAHARLGMARTFQVPVTFEDMTLVENVMVGAFLRHPHRTEARRKAREVLAFTGLDHLAEQPARFLGTPGRKRLEIARALATEPRLLLLDEALAGLTPAEVRLAIELVRRIQSLGVTIVIVRAYHGGHPVPGRTGGGVPSGQGDRARRAARGGGRSGGGRRLSGASYETGEDVTVRREQHAVAPWHGGGPDDD